MMDVNETVVSNDGRLKATLAKFDHQTGKALIHVTELSLTPSRFQISIRFANGTVTTIDYKTWDVDKSESVEINDLSSANNIVGIEIDRLD